MTPTPQGSFRLARIAGIDLYLHWSWFLVALWGMSARVGRYTSVVWPALEYLALFSIVLLHEFGHALACRQVGGEAHRIVLWPLGGVAYVSPPPRPGATLWSIAAGPLVNVLLAPCLILLTVAAQAWGWADTLPNAFGFLQAVCVINIGLLIFNLLPIYPLDGGQILQALLWFVVGRARSLMVASIIGFGGVALLIGFAVLVGWRGHSVNAAWFGILAIFILLNCWRGLLQARFWARAAKLPRRAGYACPACKQPPVRGPIWRCAGCHQPFDLFESRAVCPHCGAQFPAVPCLDCGRAHPLDDWGVPPPLPPPLPEAPARA